MLGSKFQSAEDLSWGVLQSGETFGEGKPLFPRIEEEKKQEQAKPVQKPKQNKPLTAEEVPAEMDIRAAKIIDVQNHPDADSLYVLQVDAGEGEPRTICSGLRASYKAEELKDRMIVLFANLKPAPLRGIMSNGMLFAGDTDEEHVCVLIAPPEDAKPGDRATFHGIAPAPDGRILKVKDFGKISLEVRGKVVFCGENALEIGDKPVTCDVLDGKKVH